MRFGLSISMYNDGTYASQESTVDMENYTLEDVQLILEKMVAGTMHAASNKFNQELQKKEEAKGDEKP